jgi:hypothetical protein
MLMLSEALRREEHTISRRADIQNKSTSFKANKKEEITVPVSIKEQLQNKCL